MSWLDAETYRANCAQKGKEVRDMKGQLCLFEKEAVKRPEPSVEVRVGRRTAQVSLHRRRRETLGRLITILDSLEGKDIHIGYCGGSSSHFWLNNLKLSRLKVDCYPAKLRDDVSHMPGVIVLWGSREASVRIFTDRLVNLREQEYQGYTLWLVDFWNGFGEHPLDPYRPKGCV